MSQPIRFHQHHRNAIREVSDASTTHTVLPPRRRALHRHQGEGCAEATAARAVVIGEPDAAGGVFKAVNVHPVPADPRRSCASPWKTCASRTDRCIRCSRQSDYSRYGFTPPGFVMSMWALYEKHGHATTPAPLCAC